MTGEFPAQMAINAENASILNLSYGNEYEQVFGVIDFLLRLLKLPIKV